MLVLMHESEATRGAQVDADEQRRRRAMLAAEAERLAADEQDRAARAELMAFMDALTSDRPA
jgi:hypothetical protein